MSTLQLDSGPPAAKEAHYRAALELYRTTDWSVAKICAHTGVNSGGFRSYIHRNHRDLILKRAGAGHREREAAAIKARGRRGQTPAAYAKYKDAVSACASMDYIELNISQIARLFGLNGPGLSKQLRAHYYWILEYRERERHRLGVHDNRHRGARPWCREQYASAVELLRTTDRTIAEAAESCKVSFPGLLEHLLSYHKELVRQRADRRSLSKGRKCIGALTGSGSIHGPSKRAERKYAEAVRLFRTTSMTQCAIAAKTGVPLLGLRHHLRTWHRDAILERRGGQVEAGAGYIDLSKTKHYLKSTAAKYAEAIRRVETSGESTSRVAAEFNLHPETFRVYLREHRPDLYARQGMMTTADGKVVLRRCMEKYAEAIRLYETTPESLRSIVRRLGLVYNSVDGFIHRHHPQSIEKHKQIVAEQRK